MDIQYITTNRGGKLLCYQQYLYRLNYRKQLKSYWKCNNGCRATVVLNEDLVVCTSGSHTHEPLNGVIESRNLVNKIKSRVKQESLASPISKIYKEELAKAELSSEGVARVPTFSAIKNSLYYVRNSTRPKLPDTLESLDLDERWTKSLDDEEFILSDINQSEQFPMMNDPVSELDFYISLAYISSKRSKDPNTKIGACIVDDKNRIIGLGYNGMPNNCSDDVLPWAREGDPLNTKYPYVCHAEMNAIMNANRPTNTANATIYTTMFPCNECAKLIIQFGGIKQVIFLEDRYPTSVASVAAKRLFDLVQITYRQHKPKVKSILFTFSAQLPFSIDEPDSGMEINGDDYISWSEYFMALACFSSAKSISSSLSVGACIVNTKNRVVALAANETLVKEENNNKPKSCALLKAISTKRCDSLVGFSAYVTKFPCSDCAKKIIDCRIREVVYLYRNSQNREEFMTVQRQLDFARVKHRRFKAARDLMIKLDWTTVDQT